MSDNKNLARAKAAKNDEFYTQYADIEKELAAYVEYDPDVFRGKTILCPCDDPEKSNFTKYFLDHFDDYGIEKLISTCCAGPDEMFGRRFIVTSDGHRDYRFLDGNGDFRSDEVSALRDESDMIITNPPFSLFRDFFKWEADKDFVTVGNLNGAVYTEIFPSFMGGDVWFGNGRRFTFETDNNSNTVPANVRWFTNIMHVPENALPVLMTMEENLQNSRHKVIRDKGYQVYDNYDAIEVPYIDAIPYDYDGMMGVPITYLDHNFSGFFKIVGRPEDLDRYGLKTKKYTAADERETKSHLNKSAVIKSGDKYELTYSRIFIKRQPDFLRAEMLGFDAF